MDRRRSLSPWVLFVLVLGSPVLARAAGTRGTRALVILADDVGWDLQDAAPTPNLDRMAAEGRIYRTFWSAPRCSSARAQFLSGLEPHRPQNLVGDNVQEHVEGLPASGNLIPFQLAPGNRVEWYGKLHVKGDDWPRWLVDEAGVARFQGTLANLPRSRPGDDGHYYGWTEVLCTPSSLASYDVSQYATAAVAHACVGALASGRPTLAVCALHDAHAPYQVPPPELAPQSLTSGATDAADLRTLALAKTEALDTCVGWMLEEAERQGAIVFYFADNGTNADLGGGKGSLSEAGLRTPLLVWGPGVRRGESFELVQVTDLNATLSELLGRASTAIVPEDSLAFSAELLGRSPHGGRAYLRSSMFRPVGRLPVEAHWDRCVRDRRWKLIHFGTEGGRRELYDLSADPDERTNLLDGPLTPEQSAAYVDLEKHLPG